MRIPTPAACHRVPVCHNWRAGVGNSLLPDTACANSTPGQISITVEANTDGNERRQETETHPFPQTIRHPEEKLWWKEK